MEPRPAGIQPAGPGRCLSGPVGPQLSNERTTERERVKHTDLPLIFIHLQQNEVKLPLNSKSEISIESRNKTGASGVSPPVDR
ncbi:hypothetical protein F2P81_015862 [Scophthalmus maximus]|uniref:Uncharacterized protein n=1 Tax=Scophthalmus maximus TaxID=52904 RepID=A0A6A4SDL2_SCOMX|nr:hypothetical protein F2P81_015862 [Scophthalmus maximus]